MWNKKEKKETEIIFEGQKNYLLLSWAFYLQKKKIVWFWAVEKNLKQFPEKRKDF